MLRRTFRCVLFFEIRDREDARARFHAIHEAQDVGEFRGRVEVAAEQQRGRIPRTAACELPRAGDELIGLLHGIDVLLQPIVNSGQQVHPIRCGEEISAFVVEHAALSGAGDERAGAVVAERGDIVLRVALAGTLPLLGIIGRDIDDLRKSRACDRGERDESENERDEKRANHE